MSPKLPLAVAILGLGIAACHERSLFGPADISGTYSLYRYDGATLPRQYTTDHGCTVAVWGGELDVGTDGTFSLYVRRSRQCPGAAGLEWVDLGIGGRFVLAGAELTLDIVSPTSSSLTGLLVGTHVVVPIAQAEGLAPSRVTAEFVPGGGGTTVVTTEPGTPPPIPPTDTGTTVIVVKRP